MNYVQEIEKKEKELAILKQERAAEILDHVQLFRHKMSQLISKTPTGEVRNDITDLNLLFESIVG